MKKIEAVLRSMRLPFLILTPACIFLGYSAAKASRAVTSGSTLFLIMLAAISAHISVNTFNEYFDFRSGLDLKTNKTPFSGGSGAIVTNPDIAGLVLYVAVSTLALTVITGLYFVSRFGIPLLVIGLTGVLIILTYTPLLNKHPILCLIAPGTGFGPLMVLGTYFILTGKISLLAVTSSLIPFFLVNNLLLLNQFPDIQADKTAGRRHFPIEYGTRTSTIVYAAFAMSSMLIVTSAINTGILPRTGLLTFIPLGAALVIIPAIQSNADYTRKLIPYLGINVVVAVTTPVILGLTLLYS